MRAYWRIPLVALLIAACWPAHRGRAATGLPAGFQDVLFVNGLSSASTAMEFAPDGRLFVAYQTGQLRVVKNGTLLSTPFVSLSCELLRRTWSSGCCLRSELRHQQVRVRVLHRHYAIHPQSHQPLQSQRGCRGHDRGRSCHPRLRQLEQRDQPQRRRHALRRWTGCSMPPTARTPTAAIRNR